MRRGLLVLLAAAMGVLPVGGATWAIDDPAPRGDHPAPRADDPAASTDLTTGVSSETGPVRVIVAVDDGAEPGHLGAASVEERRRANERARDAVGTRLREQPGVADIAAVGTLPFLTATVERDDLEALRDLPGVGSVAIDPPITPALDASLPRIGAGPAAPRFAGVDLTGDGTTIAIIDTGIEPSHPFFGSPARIVAEACFAYSGCDALGDQEIIGAGAAAAITAHGPHVAGIAAGADGGVDGPERGVAPGADIIAIKVFGADKAGYASDIARALDWLATEHDGAGLAAANISLGSLGTTYADVCDAEVGVGATGTPEPWAAVHAAAQALRDAGTLTVAAAGNELQRTRMTAPACLSNVLSVGATRPDGKIAIYSNLSEATDLVAPGSGIDSAGLDGTYTTLSGTSMAAPHVAGALALLRQAAPHAGPDALVDAVLTSYSSVDDHRLADAEAELPAGTVTGLPALDLPAALTALPGAPGAPGAPTDVAAEASQDGATVTWSSPAITGDSAIARYDVVANPGGQRCETAGATTCEVTGLGRDTPTTFTVTATNGSGTSASSTPSAAITIDPTAPDAPTDVTATPGDGQVSVGWTAPADDGGAPVTGYTVTSDPGAFTCSADGTSCVVTGLDNGSSYTFTVTATNTAGTSEPSAPSDVAIPASAPASPTGVAVDAGDGVATISWEPPTSDGGSPITGYTATSSPGGRSCTANGEAARDCQITGLTNGTEYTFTVTASNDVATSAPSTGVTATPRGAPAPPTDVAATRGDGEVTVSWVPPADDGGSVVTGYEVAVVGGGPTCTETASPCTVTGLTNGTPVTFQVTATNAFGTSDPSDPSPQVTPAGVPAAPTGVSATDGADARASVSWTAPDDDGGASIDGYTAVASPGGQQCSTAATDTSCEVTGLTNGTSYTFTVTATNAVGSSPASLPSTAITPTAPPVDDGGGSGGGGGGSPPPPPPPEDDTGTGDPEPVVDPDGNLPSLDPGAASVVIGGARGVVSVTSTTTSVSLSGGGMQLRLTPADTGGGATGAVSDGSMSLRPGGRLGVALDGFEPGSAVQVWLFSEPMTLGSATVGGDGEVETSVALPEDLAEGEHTLQLVGVSGDGVQAAFSIGVRVATVGFPDVDPDATHGAAILRLAELRVVGGFDDGTFGPTRTVTRGQMASFLQRALGLPLGASGAFPDTGGTTHDLAISAIVDAGIAGGFTDGTYRPNAPVTRGQMATFLANAAGLAEIADGPFSDVAGSVHAGRVNAVAEAGIARGFADGTYRPGLDVSREQMASLMTRLIDHLG